MQSKRDGLIPIGEALADLGGPVQAIREASPNLLRYFFTLLVVLPLSSPLSAQETDEDDKFFLGFAGSAVFPYDQNPLAGLGLKAGSGFTAAFGYAFKEGFSTEIEWGYQKVGIGGPSGLGRTIGPAGAVVSFGEGLPPFLIKFDGEIKTQSLMGNVYYRYPKWRVSPYVGFGLGAFFHDTTSTVSIEFGPLPPDELLGNFLLPPLDAPLTYEDSRFAYQIMGGLSARVSKRVEFRFGYRFRSSRGGPIDADQIEAGIRFRF